MTLIGRLWPLSLLALGCATARGNRPEPGAASVAFAADTVPVFSPIHALTTNAERVVGDPKAPGRPFVLRIRELPGTIAPPHTHNFDENLTVVQGTWYFGIGARFDSTALRELPAGSFVFVPRGTPMFAYAPGPVIVQVHGLGPYQEHFIDPLYTLSDSSTTSASAGRAPERFQFRLGELVISGRGAGRIREGYATGSIVEYEVVAADGSVSMAQEQDLRRQ